MKINKKILIPMLFIIMLFINGCFSMNIETKINQDGSGEFKLIYDFEAAMTMANSMSQQMGAESNEEEEEEEEQDMCENFKPEELNHDLITNLNCVSEGYKATITGEIQKDYFNIIYHDDYYEYEIKQIYELLDEMGNQSEETSMDYSDKGLNNLSNDDMSEQLGIKFTYTMIFNNEIIEYDIGQIDANNKQRLTVNLFELAKREDNPTVKISLANTQTNEITSNNNEETNEIKITEKPNGKKSYLIWIFLILILIVGIAIGLFIFLKNKKNNPQPTNPLEILNNTNQQNFNNNSQQQHNNPINNLNTQTNINQQNFNNNSQQQHNNPINNLNTQTNTNQQNNLNAQINNVNIQELIKPINDNQNKQNDIKQEDKTN
jgi:hypothetical protein